MHMAARHGARPLPMLVRARRQPLPPEIPQQRSTAGLKVQLVSGHRKARQDKPVHYLHAKGCDGTGLARDAAAERRVDSTKVCLETAPELTATSWSYLQRWSRGTSRPPVRPGRASLRLGELADVCSGCLTLDPLQSLGAEGCCAIRAHQVPYEGGVALAGELCTRP